MGLGLCELERDVMGGFDGQLTDKVYCSFE
jgi:hypothetical protein